MSDQKRRVTYYYDTEIGNYHYGPLHPMKPQRVRMTHALVLNYNLYNKMQVVRPPKASADEMTKFHSDEYIQFLERCTPETVPDFLATAVKFNTGPDCDCPIFDGLFEFCSLSAGGSIAAAQRLNHGDAQIAINWGGGLHHAKKCEASGFCYVNDIVLGILELLKYHQRVLYVDIDAHHGDGVEEAFFTTNRVMTVSFHKFGEFFPGTGDVRDVGHGKGKYYSVNFPLRDGITDETYRGVFEPIMTKVMERFRPGAIVLQCGADSLAGDRLGAYNLSMNGHADCVRFMKKFNVPMMLLGGGGYTIRNVARAWTAETGIALGEELNTDLPYNDYYEYYGPHYHLDVPQTNMENLNTKEYLHKMKTIILENLNHVSHAPSVQMHSVPQDTYDMDSDSDGDDPDERNGARTMDKVIVPENEYEESDGEK